MDVKKNLPRILLAISALIQAGGGVVHAMVFSKATTVLEATNMPAFYANSFRALWLIDSASLISVAVMLAVIIVKPALASGWLVMLLALIPLCTAVLVFIFVGGLFPPAVTLAVAALLMVVAGWLMPKGGARGV